MSIFASETTRTLEVPGDAPHTVTIRKLTGADVERAQGEHLNATIAGRSPRGWAAQFQALVAKGIATDVDATKALADPLAGYDRLTIVRAGLTAWTYTVTKDGKEAPRPVTESVVDLDDETLEFIAIEIMRLTKPGLFLTDEEREAARKNG